jgi:mono/diheme cytochrome c family protein
MFRNIAVLFILSFVVGCQKNPHADGQRLYQQHCANCHGTSGEGLGALIPPLAQADYLHQNWAILPCLIRKGVADTLVVNGKIYDQPMPSNPNLSDIEIANILNFIGNSWGNQLPTQQLNTVRTQLEKCH